MHQGSFKISNEWQPLALWIFYGFFIVQLCIWISKWGTVATIVEEVLKTPNYLGRGNNRLQTAYEIYLLERGRHTDTCTHTAVLDCGFTWNTGPSLVHLALQSLPGTPWNKEKHVMRKVSWIYYPMLFLLVSFSLPLGGIRFQDPDMVPLLRELDLCDRGM